LIEEYLDNFWLREERLEKSDNLPAVQREKKQIDS